MATGVMIAGVALTAYSQIKAGQDAKDIAGQNQAALNQTALDNEALARENMGVASREALAIEEKGIASVALKRREIARLLAYQRTQEAVSGFKYQGTPVMVAEESAVEGEQDVAMIWANTITEASEVRDRGRIASLKGQRYAEQQRRRGNIISGQGENAASAGFYSGESTLLSGASNAYLQSNMKIG